MLDFIANNHAFRMTLNSNYLIGVLKLDVGQRAALLGHSVDTNEAYYTKIRMEEKKIIYVFSIQHLHKF